MKELRLVKLWTELWEEKQKRPGDAEAVEGMGSISAHKGEHLMPTDYGDNDLPTSC